MGAAVTYHSQYLKYMQNEPLAIAVVLRRQGWVTPNHQTIEVPERINTMAAPLNYFAQCRLFFRKLKSIATLCQSYSHLEHYKDNLISGRKRQCKLSVFILWTVRRLSAIGLSSCTMRRFRQVAVTRNQVRAHASSCGQPLTPQDWTANWNSRNVQVHLSQRFLSCKKDRECAQLPPNCSVSEPLSFQSCWNWHKSVAHNHGNADYTPGPTDRLVVFAQWSFST